MMRTVVFLLCLFLAFTGLFVRIGDDMASLIESYQDYISNRKGQSTGPISVLGRSSARVDTQQQRSPSTQEGAYSREDILGRYDTKEEGTAQYTTSRAAYGDVQQRSQQPAYNPQVQAPDAIAKAVPYVSAANMLVKTTEKGVKAGEIKKETPSVQEPSSLSSGEGSVEGFPYSRQVADTTTVDDVGRVIPADYQSTDTNTLDTRQISDISQQGVTGAEAGTQVGGDAATTTGDTLQAAGQGTGALLTAYNAYQLAKGGGTPMNYAVTGAQVGTAAYNVATGTTGTTAAAGSGAGGMWSLWAALGIGLKMVAKNQAVVSDQNKTGPYEQWNPDSPNYDSSVRADIHRDMSAPVARGVTDLFDPLSRVRGSDTPLSKVEQVLGREEDRFMSNPLSIFGW